MSTRGKLTHETNHDYKYVWINVIHIETKIKSLGFLKLHDRDPDACCGMIFEIVTIMK